MSLTACFLTRNEEKFIERAIRSVQGVADQVLVVDTGSTDRTAELAAGLGATVANLTWTDDFAAGRNFTLRQAGGDWVLWVNANEELDASSHEALRAAMTHRDVFGYFVRVRNVAEPGRPGAFSETADLRLFRRRGDFDEPFVGRLHPHFRTELVERVRGEGLQVLPADVVLRAELEPGPPGASKLRFNARLLELELQDRPGQLHYLIEYGRVLVTLNDGPESLARGKAALAEAAAQVIAAKDLPAPPSQKVQVLLTYALSAAPAEAPSPGDVAGNLALRWFPDSPGLLWAVAGDRFKRKDYAGAAGVLRRLINLGRTGTYDRSHRFEPRILGEDALMNLGACHMQMRQLDEAEACFVQLAANPTWARQANQHLATIQKWRRQPLGTRHT
jgi:hypothetical protein